MRSSAEGAIGQRRGGSPTEVEGALQHAISIAREQKARLFELRVATHLAQLWRDRGRERDAYGLLAPVHGWFSEGRDTPALHAAGKVLGSLSRREPGVAVG